MSLSTKQIIAQALELPAADRATIADQLLSSLDQPDPAIDALWAKEAEARRMAYKRGEIKALSIQEVFGKYENK